jgi:hypothetical protein
MFEKNLASAWPPVAGKPCPAKLHTLQKISKNKLCGAYPTIALFFNFF